MISLEQFQSKIMLVCVQLELPKTSHTMFRLFHGWPAPPDVPFRSCAGLAETPGAAMSLCT